MGNDFLFVWRFVNKEVLRLGYRLELEGFWGWKKMEKGMAGGIVTFIFDGLER